MDNPSVIPFHFYLDWIMCAQFAGLCWAAEKGLYRQAGLDVSLIPWTDDGRSILDKVTQHADTGTLAAGSCEDNLILSRIASHDSIRAFGAMLQEPPLVLMSLPETRIADLSDLLNKHICVHPDGEQILRTIIAIEGHPIDAYDIDVVGFDLDHLVQRRCDALQGYLMTEPVQLQQLGYDVTVMPLKHHRLQPYAQVYFAESQQLGFSTAAFRAFHEASTDGWRAVLADPDEAAIVVATQMGDPHHAPQQRRMLERLLPLIQGSAPSTQLGTIPREQWARNLDTYFEFGIVTRQLSVTDVVYPL
jgi:ABC-type nitrate/sulfonate/bicarbonate transport system substrate-binding protein